MLAFADHIGLPQFSILGHDTGGTVARLAETKAPDRVEKLVLLNTEIPGHRPPFIPFYHWALGLPGSYPVMRALLKTRAFRHSRFGFGNLFADRTLIEGTFAETSTNYFAQGAQKFSGLAAYLRGLDFGAIDQLDAVHAQISAPILFVWGAKDKTFPMAQGKEMAEGIKGDVVFAPVANCCFLPHEEWPVETATQTLAFFGLGQHPARSV